MKATQGTHSGEKKFHFIHQIIDRSDTETLRPKKYKERLLDPSHESSIRVEVDVDVLLIPLTGKGRFVDIPWEPGTARSPITRS
jgi:hypothetical protein